MFLIQPTSPTHAQLQSLSVQHTVSVRLDGYFSCHPLCITTFWPQSSKALFLSLVTFACHYICLSLNHIVTSKTDCRLANLSEGIKCNIPVLCEHNRGTLCSVGKIILVYVIKGQIMLNVMKDALTFTAGIAN